MKRSTKQSKQARSPRSKRANAKTASTESRGQNSAEPKMTERQRRGEEQKKRLESLPLAGQGRTVISPTPLDEVPE